MKKKTKQRMARKLANDIGAHVFPLLWQQGGAPEGRAARERLVTEALFILMLNIGGPAVTADVIHSPRDEPLREWLQGEGFPFISPLMNATLEQRIRNVLLGKA